LPPDPLQLQLPLPQPQPGSGRQATLADKLCELLLRRGRPLEVGHVVAQVLRMRTCPEKLQRRLVAEIVDGDARLAWRGRDVVGLAPPGWAATHVREATFCVLDIETTGGSPGRSKITEIGAARMRGGRIIDRFATLVDPGRPIPVPITRITGIHDGMLVGQPKIEEALERFVEFVGDDVMVAHNAPFDFRFLNYERFRINGKYFTQPWLDTLVIARRILRKRLDRFDLGTLAEWADTEVRPNHRALPDAEATAHLLAVLLERLVDRGLTTLEQAVAFGQGGGARHAHKLALAEDLPQTPGVYLMRDREGAVLYVGKARNLRRRVRSYFGPQGRHGRLIARALEGVASIDHEETGSELSALLRETALLRELRPPCNTRGVRTGAGRFLKLTTGDPFPRLYVVAEVLDDGAAYYGPVRSERLARQAIDALHVLYPIQACHPRCAGGRQERLLEDDVPTECRGPCRAENVDAYQEGIEDVRCLLEADQGAAAAMLVARLAEQMTDHPFAFADPTAREAIEALLAMLGALARVRFAADVGGVIVEPATEPGVATALFIWHGRVVAQEEIGPATPVAARAGLAALARASGRPPDPLAPGELDAAMILHDWLRARADHPGVVSLRPGFDEVVALAAVDRAVRAMITFQPDAGPAVAGEGFANAA
jgi:DNA polymerase-3 subunit epsilon